MMRKKLAIVVTANTSTNMNHGAANVTSARIRLKNMMLARRLSGSAPKADAALVSVDFNVCKMNYSVGGTG